MKGFGDTIEVHENDVKERSFIWNEKEVIESILKKETKLRSSNVVPGIKWGRRRAFISIKKTLSLSIFEILRQQNFK